MESTSEQARYTHGMAVLAEVNGGSGEDEVEPLGDLGRYIVEFGFGDIYSRTGLSLREREFAAVAMLVAMGGREQQLQYHLGAALRVGVPTEQLKELIIQAALFAGFPLAINALSLLNQAVKNTSARDNKNKG